MLLPQHQKAASCCLPLKAAEKTMMHSFPCQGLSLSRGTAGSGLQGWASAVWTWKSLTWRGGAAPFGGVGLSVPLTMGGLEGLASGKRGRAAQGRERSCAEVAPAARRPLPHTPEDWRSRFAQDQGCLRTPTQRSLAKDRFLRRDNELWFACCKDGGNL